MAKLKGMTVILYEPVETGKDGFGRPVYDEIENPIENVLIGEPSSDEIAETLDTTGKKIAYTLAIPKGDNHDWKDKKVKFFGTIFKVIGFPTEGQEENIPLSWNKKVKVERYE